MNGKCIRFRKTSIKGGTIVAYNLTKPKFNCEKTLIEFPIIENSELISQVQFQNDFEQKCNSYRPIKSLVKAYVESKKKNNLNSISIILSDQSINIGHPSYRFTKRQSNFFKDKSNMVTERCVRNKKQNNKYLSVQTKNTMNSFRRTSLTHQKESQQFKEKNQSTSIKDQIGKIQATNLIVNKIIKPLVPIKRMKPKQKKNSDYLYQRLAAMEGKSIFEFNQVYEKRIWSYLQFICKLQISHNMIPNLDIKIDDLSNRSKKLKAYVSKGNNSAMIKGLLKRRFWWIVCDEKPQYCQFLWTQIKNPGFFNQQRQYAYQYPIYIKNKEEDVNFQGKKNNRKNKEESELFNSKIMHKLDMQCFQKIKQFGDFYKENNFNWEFQIVGKKLYDFKQNNNITVHNHLKQNYMLGNKKALFYNLKQYYNLRKENIFEHTPLTYHIKRGIKDQQYKLFVQTYQKKNRMIKKEQNAMLNNKLMSKNIWIVKPGQNSNQGRGILVIDEIYELNNILKKQKDNQSYVVQMYLDKPFLYNKRKFDIRHFMLITNLFGVLRAYWYEQGYIRTSSYEFNLNSFQPEVHLTNDSIQKKYPQYGKYEPYNKLSYKQFQTYLDFTQQKYNFKDHIIPKMKQIAKNAVCSVQGSISPGNLGNNFQILGLDFMIDHNFKPWLIQINTNPCLDCSCSVLDRIIPYMVEQSFKLSLDVIYPPPTHYPQTTKHYAPFIDLQNFKYQLIFDSQIQGEQLTMLFRKMNSLDSQIGSIEQNDQQFKDEGKQIKLAEFS